MRQVSAMGEIHAQNRIAGFAGGEVDSHVGLGSGVRLNVGMFGAEQFLGAVNGQLFNHIHIFTASIVSFTWVALCIFVGKYRTLRFQNSFGNEVL